MRRLLEVEAVSYSYGAGDVVREVSFSVGGGEFVSLIGPNGSGKTTLMSLVSGYRRCTAGRILLAGREIGDYLPMERARVLAVVAQNENLNVPFTCMELAALGLYPHKSRFQAMTQSQLEEIRTVMELTDTQKLAGRRIDAVSGGELQRVVLARALLQKPKLLLLDEAMSDLDISAKIAMVKCLKTMVQDKGIGILAINHDLANAYQFSDRILVMKDGALAGAGSPGEALTEASLGAVFGLRARIKPDEGLYVYDNIDRQESTR